ncbi:MAG TPA: ATP-binding protein [Tepidisphaeraceae bacterium]|nr:ATP-binding protein [Tepidisphaeraceae bacterium]
MLILEQVIAYRIDSIVFCAALTLAVIAVSRSLRKRHGAGLPPSSSLLLGILIVAGFIMPEVAGERERARLQKMLDGIAPTYAQELELLGHSRLTLDTPADDPDYLKMIESQKRWLAVNPNVCDIYTYRKSPDGGIMLMVDSETDYDRNGVIDEDREARTDLGEIYPDATEAMLLALDGKANFDPVPYTDRWGTWVSASVPLRDSSGQVEGAVGVDFNASTWLAAIAGNRGAALSLVVIVGTTLLSTGVVVVVTKSELAKREALENERSKLQDQLLLASRKAGQAEIATDVLHNVGNVLNSVNVSARMINDCVRASRLPSLGKLAGLIEQEKARLGEFVTSDSRGRCLPEFLSQLHAKLNEDQSAIQKEVDQLVVGIEHIKEVVRMQQSSASASTMYLPTEPTAVVEDALKMNLVSMERHQVHLHREYEPGLSAVPMDKHKILQILVNLISNAKKATCHPDVAERHVTLRVRRVNRGDAIEFEVQDNGVGIAPDALAKLFRHGYTTFEGGHGFGLHSGANAAGEMRGSLTARSDGPGTGATFTLTIPVQQTQGAARKEAA